MKRSLLFAAIAAVAFSSCSKDDAISINETSKGIGFGVLNNKVQSRATETTVANIGGFSVYAYAHAVGENANYITGTPYYNGVSITVDATGGCTYTDGTKQKMWPKTEQLDFLAYSPADYGLYLTGTVSVDMSAKLEANNQQDLVVAKKLNESGVGVDNYKTEMKFNHALSQIKFKAVSKYSTVNFKVKSIKITGVNLQGITNLTTWAYAAPNGATNTGNGLEWVMAGEVGNVAFGAKTTETINTTAVDLTAANGALMVIPQTLKGGAAIEKGVVTVENILTDKTKSYIVIEYSATDKETGAVLVTNGRCAAPVSTDLKAGLRYVYTMTLAGKGDGGTTEDKLYPIDFTCTVEGWVDGPAVGGEI